MLAAAGRRHVGNRAFQNLQQRLLHAFAADIPGDGRIFAATGNFIDFIHIYNAAFRFFHIVIRRLNQAKQNILHILAHVSRFGQRGSVGDGKRNIQRTSKRLR